MKVLEFGFWLPPKVKKVYTDKHGTDFTFNALPIWGFVRIAWEDITSPDAFKEGNFMSRSWIQRVAVLIAGVTMNFLLAYLLFFGLMISGTKPLSPIPMDIGPTNSYFLPSIEEAVTSGFLQKPSIVLSPLTGSVAEVWGIKPKDTLYSIDWHTVTTPSDVSPLLTGNTPKNIVVERNWERIPLSITPENGKIGVEIRSLHKINKEYTRDFSFPEALVAAWKETYTTSIITYKLIISTLHGLLLPATESEKTESIKNLSGPIGAGSSFITMIENHVPLTMIILFVALLSINLWVVNILPFPALDWGRILFTTLYSIGISLWIPAKHILKAEAYIHSFGFMLLLLFMLYVSGLDIKRLFF